METKGFVGQISGIPIRGGAVSLDDADASLIINSTAGLIKSITPLALAGGVLALLICGSSTKNEDSMAISSLAHVYNEHKSFYGVCLDENIECECGGTKIIVPINTIHRINCSEMKTWCWGGYYIHLVDGSHFSICNILTKSIKFLTLCGIQELQFYRNTTVQKGFFQKHPELRWETNAPFGNHTIIQGQTTSNVRNLRKRLKFAFVNDHHAVIESIGQEIFHKYFLTKST